MAYDAFYLYRMKKSGSADLPLHYGKVPAWLHQRMARLGEAVVEAVILEYGKDEVLRRLSDPFWFQSLGAVMGMDWHSSGITTSVMGALKKAINPRSKELGIYITGGKGKHSRETPNELWRIGEQTGLDANKLIRSSKLSAKVDNTAIQDGFQIYMHNFILTDTGNWTVVQQGMSDASGMARRYHWHSANLQSFVEEPHTAIHGANQGLIMNLTSRDASKTRGSLMEMSKENPDLMLKEIRKLVMPNHHEVKAKDVDLKRLGAILWLSQEKQPKDFEELLLLQGLGPRTLQSLTLVSEVIYGTPSRFKDPARFAFAHGGKDGHPFPVPVNTYDETLSVLKTAINKAKIGNTDRQQAIASLSKIAKQAESSFIPNENFDQVIERERKNSWKYGGKTVFGPAKKPKGDTDQLRLF